MKQKHSKKWRWQKHVDLNELYIGLQYKGLFDSSPDGPLQLYV